MKFSDKNYRLFVTAAKLVPTGYLLDTITHGGKVWGKFLKGVALYPAIAAKEAEEICEVQCLFQSMDARHESLVAEIADAYDILAFARKKLSGVPPASDQKRNLPALKAELLALAAAPVDEFQREQIRQFIPIAENSLKVWCRSPGNITQDEINEASYQKESRFGVHQGWQLQAMALPRNGPPEVQKIVTKLRHPHWVEVDPAYFKASEALTVSRIKAVTPQG